MSGQPDAEPSATPIPRIDATTPPRGENVAPPRVAITAPLRVANTAPPRVATTSNTITAPEKIRRLPRIHQRVTRANNPFNILSDDDDNAVVHSNRSPPPATIQNERIEQRSERTANPPRTSRPRTIPTRPPASPPPPTHNPTAMPTTFAQLPTAVPTTVAWPPPPMMVHPPPTTLPCTSLRPNSPHNVHRGKQDGRVPAKHLHTQFILPAVPAADQLHHLHVQHPM
jgi:hypothetical protein